MNEKIANAETQSSFRALHWLVALPLTAWCLSWLAFNSYNYVRLTWHIFASLKWLSFALLINPCFWIWLGLFSSSTWAPLDYSAMPWGKFGGTLTRKKVVLVVVLVPMLLGLALVYLGPYFYPIATAQSGETAYHVRFVPIFGGKGFN